MSFISPAKPSAANTSVAARSLPLLPLTKEKNDRSIFIPGLKQEAPHIPKLMDERRVTIHSRSMQDTSVQEVTQEIAGNTLAGIKKKKKKKKKPVESRTEKALSQTAASEQLGSSFVLPPLNSSLVKPRTSLFLEPYCPELTKEEQALFNLLLEGSAFSENINLFEVFLTEFAAVQKTLAHEISAIIGPIDQELAKSHLAFHKSPDLMSEVYLLYNYTFGKEEDELGFEVEKNYNKGIFRKIPSCVDWLNSYDEDLKEKINEIKRLQNFKTFEKSQKVHALYQNNFKPLYDRYDLLNKMVRLLSKCLKLGDVTTLFLKKKTSDWSESYQDGTHICQNKRLAYVTKFINFIRVFLVQAKKLGIVGYEDEEFPTYAESIEQMAQKNFSKDSIINFVSQYKIYSAKTLQRLTGYFQILRRAQNDQTFTYAKYCADDTSQVSQEGFISMLVRMNISLDIADKWINDINQTMMCHFLAEVEGTYFNSPQSYIQRLLLMFDLSTNFDDSLSTETSTDPLIQEVINRIKSFIKDAEIHFKDVLTKDFTFLEIQTGLRYRFTAPVFRLSHCQLFLNPIHKAAIKSDLSQLRLDKILHEILQTIRVAKENYQLDDIDPSELKTKLQDLLLNLSLPLCTYVMIIEDTKALFSKSRKDDVLHLLPNSLVKLLNLKGFDEIFLKTPTFNIELTKPVMEELPQSLLTQQETHETFNLSKREPLEEIKRSNALTQTIVPSKKSQKPELSVVNKTVKLPDNEDFKAADKRRLIHKLLDRMNCELARINGSHHIYRHRETNKIVVVPIDVSKPGTRKSIYNQATDASQSDNKQD